MDHRRQQLVNELLRQLEDIKKKQEEIEINRNLANICKELGSFTGKIRECADKGIDLPKEDKERIQELNNNYNSNIERFKKLKGLG